MKKIAIILFLMGIKLTNLLAQDTYKPLAYWTFNSKNGLADSTGNGNDLIIEGEYNLEQKALNLSEKTGEIILKSLKTMGKNTLNQSFSYELLFKYKTYAGSADNIPLLYSDVIKISFSSKKIVFTTTHLSSSTTTSNHSLIIPLNGTAQNSLSYYNDENWHHLVFNFDTKTGIKAIYVDGECPNSFSVQQDSLKRELSFKDKKMFRFNGTNAYNKNVCILDEMAIYDKALPISLIQKHYKEIQAGKSYSYKNDQKIIHTEIEREVKEKYDPKDFAPKHPNVEISTLTQLQTFPLPRYKFSHSLLPNFNWVEMTYLGKETAKMSKTDFALNKVALNFELAKNWHYYLVLTQYLRGGANPDFIKQCNENPWFPIEVISFWAITQPKRNYKLATKNNIRYYLNDGKGNFVEERPQWNPVMPLDSIQLDGRNNLKHLETNFLSQLTRPINILNDDAEVFTYLYPSSTLEKSPEVVADKNKNFPNWDWYKYQSYKKYRFDSTYVSEMMNHPKLKNTIFSFYQMEGEHPIWRFDYNITKKTTSKIRNQYYSTPDIYPVYHHNWAGVSGAWHGWAWLPVCRTIEMEQGDKLFSPFVSAGWSANEEKNLRPGRWLGMLKAMSLLGAEFYYTGFFNLKDPFPSPRNYVWQMASSPYAQAITSRFQDILFNGKPLEGDLKAANEKVPQYRFFTGNPQHLVAARKHNTKNQYVISGSIQPNTIEPNSIPLIDTVSIKLEGENLRFEIRRQGSTYFYDNTNPSKPIFYQLDKWHQYEHPAWWTANFEMEAEVIDSQKVGNTIIQTETPQNAKKGDFSAFTSYISGKGETGYLFQTRDIPAHKNLKLKVRARVAGGGNADLQVQLDKNATDYKQPKKYTGTLLQSNTLEIKGKEWKWYDLDKKTNKIITYAQLPSEEANMLWLKSSNEKIEIDAIQLIAE